MLRGKYFFLILILILAAVRVTMPYILMNYMSAEINKLPEYRVKIADVDMSLILGSYTLKNIQLWKLNDQSAQPFLRVSAMNISLQWSALLKGRIVAKVDILHPIIN